MKVSQVSQVSCPKCGAQPRSHCRTPKGRRYYFCHRERWENATLQQHGKMKILRRTTHVTISFEKGCCVDVGWVPKRPVKGLVQVLHNGTIFTCKQGLNKFMDEMSPRDFGLLAIRAEEERKEACQKVFAMFKDKDFTYRDLVRFAYVELDLDVISSKSVASTIIGEYEMVKI